MERRRPAHQRRVHLLWAQLLAEVHRVAPEERLQVPAQPELPQEPRWDPWSTLP